MKTTTTQRRHLILLSRHHQQRHHQLHHYLLPLSRPNFPIPAFKPSATTAAFSSPPTPLLLPSHFHLQIKYATLPPLLIIVSCSLCSLHFSSPCISPRRNAQSTFALWLCASCPTLQVLRHILCHARMSFSAASRNRFSDPFLWPPAPQSFLSLPLSFVHFQRIRVLCITHRLLPLYARLLCR